MQFTTILLLAAPLLALAKPAPKPMPELQQNTIEKRTTSCNVIAANVNKRTCPAACCDSVATYPLNTAIQVDCWENGSVINGYQGWFRVTDNNTHYWVSNYYIDQSCWNTIGRCA